MNKWPDECMNIWKNEGMNEWIIKLPRPNWNSITRSQLRVSEWMNGWMSDWMNEWMNV